MTATTIETLHTESVTSALLARAQGHPRVLEIMADCADAIDAENSAFFAELGEDDGRYLRAARELRERAAAIRAEDPEIWED